MTTPYRILNADGSLAPGASSKLDMKLALEGLRWMKLSREYDTRTVILNRQGKWGGMSPPEGQEATFSGTAMALDPSRDWIVPAYRDAMATVQHGFPLVSLMANFLGKSWSYGRIPDDVKIFPAQIAVGSQMPQAVGLAWGLKLKEEDSVVLVFIGDGAASEGDFHEALNLAGVIGAPIVFVVVNNGYAISTPTRSQTAASFALRAAGYGFPGVSVDGNDLFATYEVTSNAVARARAGGGPTLIEALTYRLAFHNTDDNPTKYRTAEEVDEARKRDPINRLETYLRGLGLWDDDKERETQLSISAELETAMETARAYPPPDPMELFDNHYADPPVRFQAQRAEFLNGLKAETIA
jgi:pyruvate dehydrogenase E1 component alpha subunit